MRCVVIAGSPEINIELITKTVSRDDFVVCADKGLLYALKAGVKPDLIVGDFDSYCGKIPSGCDIITLNTHKDYTDTAHCIDLAFERGFRDFVIIGALGGRLDHTFANIAALMSLSLKGGRGELISDKEKVIFLRNGRYSFDNMKGLTFSLFPFGCQGVNLSVKGAEYPLTHYSISAEVTLGVSNVFTEDKSEIEINDGNAIIVINLIKV